MTPRLVLALAMVVALVTGCETPAPTPATSAAGSPAAAAGTASLSQGTEASPAVTAAADRTASPRPFGGHWEPAGTTAVDRAGSHAVLLGDGRVLVVGHEAFEHFPTEPVNDDSAVAELWDPATGIWSRTDGLNNPRGDFAMVPLLDGRAVVIGGRNQTDQSFSSTYLYDPRPGVEAWSKAGLLGTARTAPAAAVLPDGRVLVAGGYYRIAPTFGNRATNAVLAVYEPASRDEPGSSRPRPADMDPPNVGAALATAELFDPATATWSAAGHLTFARFGAAAVTLADGRILIVGSGPGTSGVSVDDRAYSSAELYDPDTGRFTLVGSLPDIDRAALEKAGVPGANPVPLDDPVTEEMGTLVALNDGDAVLVGHTGSWKHVGDITRSFRYDVQTASWTEIGRTYVFVGEPTAISLVTPDVRRLSGAMVAALPDGRLIVAGGLDDNVNPYGTVELLDPATNAWSPLPDMPEARAGGAIVVLRDGSVLIVGGAWEPATLRSAVRLVPTP